MRRYAIVEPPSALGHVRGAMDTDSARTTVSALSPAWSSVISGSGSQGPV